MVGRIVSIGECMVEMAPDADGRYRMGFAGDALNFAWYLRRCLGGARDRHDDPAKDRTGDGTGVDFLTAVGTDPLSDRMVAFLRDAGLGTGLVARVPERTVGLYLIQLDRGERSFAYWRENSAARLLAADPVRLAAALAGAGVVYFSGITLAILSPADRAQLLSALATARVAGARIVFDPNLRPRLWPDARTMRAAVSQAATGADIVLPSFDDEAARFGDRDTQATARRYAALGAGLVVVKNGAGEMLALQDGTETRLRPAPVASPVDTTAAGDSFNAGFLADLLRGASVGPAMASGAALAARVIAARGALVET